MALDGEGGPCPVSIARDIDVAGGDLDRFPIDIHLWNRSIRDTVDGQGKCSGAMHPAGDGGCSMYGQDRAVRSAHLSH